MSNLTLETDWIGSRIGMVYWKKVGGILSFLNEGFESLGCETVKFSYNQEIPPDLDIIFVFGPDGSLVPLIDNILALPKQIRPILVIHHSEQFPDPDMPRWISYPLATLRSNLEQKIQRRIHKGGNRKLPFEWITRRSIRFRYLGDVHWIRKLDLKFLISVESPLTADYLRKRGLKVVETHGFGFPWTPDWGANLNLERDIPVLWIGKFGSRRRERLLYWLRSELKARNIDMMFIDGVENPYVFGEERTTLLNRSKIVVNIMRKKWDNNAGRFYLAALNRALLITEPMLPHNIFILPGVHLIESPIDQLVSTIVYYIDHEDEREKIATQAQQLVTKEITVQNTLTKILNGVDAQIKAQMML